MTRRAGPVEVVSFGCRLNTLEAAAIERVARESGRSNLVVINTCAVTAEAVRQARQSIRRIARERPGVDIVVTGCAGETSPETFLSMPEVAGVVANAAKTEPAGWSADPAPLGDRAPPIRALSDAVPGHTRAFLQVQNGCDHRCTFCIIPYGRGAARSTPMSEAVEAAARLVDQGAAEVVLTGVDLTSWGADLGQDHRLGDLVRAILAGVPGLRRLRLSSIDSIEADDRLIDSLACEHRLMPHLHLSLQAGDDVILKRMKRRHGFADAVRFCENIRRLRPDIVFGADIIAGFPTETEAMFARSLDLIEACGLTHLHVFPFSPRPGTPAQRMPQVDPSVRRERAARLRTAGEAALGRHLDRQIGRRLEVLAENGGVGRAADFTQVVLGAPTPAGRFLTVRPVAHDGRRLLDAAADGQSRLVAVARAE